jgi:hypothetical protein
MESKVCSWCKEELPISAFGTVTKKNTGTIVIKSRCNKCLNQIANDKYHENMKDPAFRGSRYNYLKKWRNTEYTKAYNKSYNEKNRNVINEKQNARLKKSIDECSDSYVRRKLSQDPFIKMPGSAYPKELVEIKRYQIILKRQIKSLKHGTATI